MFYHLETRIPEGGDKGCERCRGIRIKGYFEVLTCPPGHWLSNHRGNPGAQMWLGYSFSLPSLSLKKIGHGQILSAPQIPVSMLATLERKILDIYSKYETIMYPSTFQK